MPDVIAVMKRREIKYILNEWQCQYLKKALEGHMKIDKFGLCSIASLYSFNCFSLSALNTVCSVPQYSHTAIDALSS